MTAEQYTGTCEQETCPFWPGHGCACDLLDIDHEERRRAQRELGIDLEDAAERPGRKPTRDEVRAVVAYELNEIPEYELEEVDSTTDAVIDLYDRAAKGEL